MFEGSQERLELEVSQEVQFFQDQLDSSQAV